jgi:2-haloacid dehalogenase
MTGARGSTFALPFETNGVTERVHSPRSAAAGSVQAAAGQKGVGGVQNSAKMPTMPPLKGIRACVFDAYGTLFDFASAAARCRDVLGDKTDRLTTLWRDKQLQYTWLRSMQGHYVDFLKVTGDALDYAMETLDISDAKLRHRLIELYLNLKPFPEIRGVLGTLKDAGFVTAILSNGSPSMLAAAVENARIGKLLDVILSVDAVGVYKPDRRVYQLAVERLNMAANTISFQSSNAWDAYAASAFGMRVVWCNRYGQRPERLKGSPDRIVGSLAELPAILGIPE